MSDRDEELRRFTTQVMFRVLTEGLATVTKNDGELPSVACLDEEPMRDVLERVEAAGGSATVFCRGPRLHLGSYRVRIGHFIDADCALMQEPEDMTSEAPSGDTTIGMYFDYLEKRPQGVVIPSRLDSHVEAAQLSREIEFSYVS